MQQQDQKPQNQNIPSKDMQAPKREMEDGEEESIEAVPLYKNVKVVIPMFLVVLAIAIFAWNYYLQLRDYVSTDDAYIDADRVSVSPKILGRIDLLTVDEGDSVKEGQTLVRLDDSDLRAQEVRRKHRLRLPMKTFFSQK